MLSASAGSLESVLNHSRGEEDEEIRVIMDTTYDDGHLENHPSDIFGNNNSSWEESSLNSNISHITDQCDYNRLSNTDSGFMSSQSYRSSSYSKRSSQQSSVSTQWVSKQMSETVKSESVMHNLVKESEGHLSVKSFNHKSSSSSNSSLVSTIVNTQGNDTTDSIPPAIPQKTRKKQERQPSPYDNVPDSNLGKNCYFLYYFELIIVNCRRRSFSKLSNASIALKSVECYK